MREGRPAAGVRSPAPPRLRSLSAHPDMDRRHLARAIELAEQGRGRVSPNPLVGAVIAAPDGSLLGEGWHGAYGGPHAEVEAIRAAGEDATAATTMDVSPKPCGASG